MNLRGPISQKQFLYVGYTHLEWLLVPPGPQHTTHSYWRWPMKYRTPFIGHMLFIYFHLSPVAFFLPLPPSPLLVLMSVSHPCCFFFHSLLFSSHHAKLQEVTNEKKITFYRTHTVLFFFFISAASSLTVCLCLALFPSLSLSGQEL